MVIICQKHNETSDFYECKYCARLRRWDNYNNRHKRKKINYVICEKHWDRPYRLSCDACSKEKNQEIIDRLEKQEKERAEAHQKWCSAIKEIDKHSNEQCANCDKPINFDEWFCYCSLCPDCFLKSDEDINNWLNSKSP